MISGFDGGAGEHAEEADFEFADAIGAGDESAEVREAMMTKRGHSRSASEGAEELEQHVSSPARSPKSKTNERADSPIEFDYF